MKTEESRPFSEWFLSKPTDTHELELSAWVETMWVPKNNKPLSFNPLKRSVVFQRDAEDACICTFIEGNYVEFGLLKGKNQGKKTRPGVLFQRSDACAIFIITKQKRGSREIYIGSRENIRSCLEAALHSIVEDFDGLHTTVGENCVQFSSPLSTEELKTMNERLPVAALNASYAAFVTLADYGMGDRLKLLGAGTFVHEAVRRVFHRFFEPTSELKERVVKKKKHPALEFRIYSPGDLSRSGVLIPRNTVTLKRNKRDTNDVNYAFRSWDIHPSGQFDVLACATVATFMADWTGGCNHGAFSPSQMANYMMMHWFYSYRGSSKDPYPVQRESLVLGDKVIPKSLTRRAFMSFMNVMASVKDLNGDSKKDGINEMIENVVAGDHQLLGLSKIGATYLSEETLDLEWVKKAFINGLGTGEDETDQERLDNIMGPALSCAESAVRASREELESVRYRIPKGMTIFRLDPISRNNAMIAILKYMGPSGYIMLHMDGWLRGSKTGSRDGKCKGGTIYYVPLPYHRLQVTLEHAFKELDGISKLILSDSTRVSKKEKIYIPVQKNVNIENQKETGQGYNIENISSIAHGYPVCSGGSILFIARGWDEVLKCVLFYLNERISGSRSSMEIPVYPIVCSWLMPVISRLAMKAAKHPEVEKLSSQEMAMAQLTDSRVVYNSKTKAYEARRSSDSEPSWEDTNIAAQLTFVEKIKLVTAFRTASWWFESNRSSRLLQNLGPLAFSSVSGCVGLIKVIVDFWGTQSKLSDEWALWQATVDIGPADIGGGWVDKDLTRRSLWGEETKTRKRSDKKKHQVAHIPLMEAIRVVTQTDARLEWTDRAHFLLGCYLSNEEESKWAWDDEGKHMDVLQYLMLNSTACCTSQETILEDVVPVTIPPSVVRGMWDLLFDSRMPYEISQSILFRTQTDNHHEILDRKGTRFSTAINTAYKRMFPHLFVDQRIEYHKRAAIARIGLRFEAVNTVKDNDQYRRALLLAPVSTGSRSVVLYSCEGSDDKETQALVEEARIFEEIVNTLRETERLKLVSNHIIGQGSSRTRWWSQRGTTAASRQRKNHETEADCESAICFDNDLDGFLCEDFEEEPAPKKIKNSVETSDEDDSLEMFDLGVYTRTETVPAKKEKEEEEEEEMEVVEKPVEIELRKTKQDPLVLIRKAKSKLKCAIDTSLTSGGGFDSLERSELSRTTQPTFNPEECVDNWRNVDTIGPKATKKEEVEIDEDKQLYDSLYKKFSSPIIQVFRMLERSGYKDDRKTPLFQGVDVSHDVIRDYENSEFPVCIDKERILLSNNVKPSNHSNPMETCVDHRAYGMYNNSMAMFRIYPAYARMMGEVDSSMIADLTDFWALRKTRAYQ